MMGANGEGCTTCGAMAQVETSHADGSFTYYCLSHSNAVDQATNQYAQVAPSAPAPAPAPATQSAPIIPVNSLGV